MSGKNSSTTEDLAGTVPATAVAPGTITLETPLKRGDQAITSISLRKPAAGELRGIALADLLRLDVAALITVLPRITTPTLTADEALRLDPADLTACGLEIASFLLPKRLQPAPDGLAAASASPAG